MICPVCNKGRGYVKDTRKSGADTRRRYKCEKCPARWSTLETIVVTNKRRLKIGRRVGPSLRKVVKERHQAEARAVIRQELHNIFGVKI